MFSFWSIWFYNTMPFRTKANCSECRKRKLNWDNPLPSDSRPRFFEWTMVYHHLVPSKFVVFMVLIILKEISSSLTFIQIYRSLYMVHVLIFVFFRMVISKLLLLLTNCVFKLENGNNIKDKIAGSCYFNTVEMLNFRTVPH